MFVRVSALALAGYLSLGAASAEPLDGVWRVQMSRTGGICDRDTIRYSVNIRNGAMRYMPDPGDVALQFSGRVSDGGRVHVWAKDGMAEVNASGELQGRAGSGVWKASLLGCSGSWTARKT